jgi:hypothetical protein
MAFYLFDKIVHGSSPCIFLEVNSLRFHYNVTLSGTSAAAFGLRDGPNAQTKIRLMRIGRPFRESFDVETMGRPF